MTLELDEKLSALLDDELSAEETEALREEIARRPDLARRLAELAAVDAELRALPGRSVPVDLRARLGARVHADRMASSRRPPRPRRRRWLEAAAVAAAAAVLALVVLPRLRSSEAPRPGAPEPEVVARAEPEPTTEVVARAGPEADLDLLAEELLAPSVLPAAEVEENDLPVIAVLDVLAELDELEGAG